MELLGLISSLHLLSLLFMHCAGTPRGECLPGLCIKTVIEGNVAPPGADSPSGAEVNRNKQNSCRLFIIPCAIQNVNKNRNDCYRLPRRAVSGELPTDFARERGRRKAGQRREVPKAQQTGIVRSYLPKKPCFLGRVVFRYCTLTPVLRPSQEVRATPSPGPVARKTGSAPVCHVTAAPAARRRAQKCATVGGEMCARQ